MQNKTFITRLIAAAVAVLLLGTQLTVAAGAVSADGVPKNILQLNGEEMQNIPMPRTGGEGILPSQGEKGDDDVPKNVLRLHVIANSDSEEDQRVKLLVRDELLRFEGECFLGETKEETKASLMENGGAVLELVEEVLRENGFDYGAQLKIGVYDFPDREYAGELYPAGRYEALRIVLGKGEGHNWWCVMFPPLCIIETNEGDANGEKTEETEFESFFVTLFKRLFGIE